MQLNYRVSFVLLI